MLACMEYSEFRKVKTLSTGFELLLLIWEIFKN